MIKTKTLNMASQEGRGGGQCMSGCQRAPRPRFRGDGEGWVEGRSWDVSPLHQNVLPLPESSGYPACMKPSLPTTPSPCGLAWSPSCLPLFRPLLNPCPFTFTGSQSPLQEGTEAAPVHRDDTGFCPSLTLEGSHKGLAFLWNKVNKVGSRGSKCRNQRRVLWGRMGQHSPTSSDCSPIVGTCLMNKKTMA